MKRRTALKTLVAVPAAAHLPAQAEAAQSPQKPASDESAKLQTTTPDHTTQPLTQFFSSDEFAALQHLSNILVPALEGAPGAIEGKAPEFLDFLISKSPSETQQLYRSGLQQLNTTSKQHYQKPFSEITASQADALLSPLKEPWTYSGPSDPFARFLLTAKEDVMRATLNSREWAAFRKSRSRFSSGLGTYWRYIE